jgi:hypothetical protein
MKKQLALIIPILAAMLGLFAIVGLNSVNAQSMSTTEINMTDMSNFSLFLLFNISYVILIYIKSKPVWGNIEELATMNRTSSSDYGFILDRTSDR